MVLDLEDVEASTKVIDPEEGRGKMQGSHGPYLGETVHDTAGEDTLGLTEESTIEVDGPVVGIRPMDGEDT